MTQTLRFKSGTQYVVLAQRTDVADTFIKRTKGLLGKSQFSQGEALWIKSCNSIHTFFMKFSIDAIFVDKNLKVVSTYHGLRPWRITRIHFKASSVFELPAGTLAEHARNVLQLGDQLEMTNHVSKAGGHG